MHFIHELGKQQNRRMCSTQWLVWRQGWPLDGVHHTGLCVQQACVKISEARNATGTRVSAQQDQSHCIHLQAH
jgi:hypothetical protein